MVVSKKCKICAALDANNVSISGEYFGKLIPDLIMRICGVELDTRKAIGVLICQPCIIQLVHTDMVIEKLRNAVQRLKINVKQVKPKTPLKDSSTGQTKSSVDFHNNTIENGDQDANKTNEHVSQLSIDEARPQIGKTPKKIAKNNIAGNKKNETPKSVQHTTLAMDSSAAKAKEAVNLNTTGKVKESNQLFYIGGIGSLTKKKTSEATKKVGLPKSIYTEEKSEDNVAFSKGDEKTTLGINNMKFKKFLDDVTPTEKTPSKAEKRKPLSTDGITNSLPVANDTGPTPTKRNKTMSGSLSDEHAINLTVNEEDGNETSNANKYIIKENEVKVINCILCDKVFHSKSILRNHIETAHMGERLKACPHCSSEFRSRQKYDSHVFSEKCKNTFHACQNPKCNKRFKTLHKMELHMQEKHPSQSESTCE